MRLLLGVACPVVRGVFGVADAALYPVIVAKEVIREAWAAADTALADFYATMGEDS